MSEPLPYYVRRQRSKNTLIASSDKYMV